jgi:hypothetical protein
MKFKCTLRDSRSTNHRCYWQGINKHYSHPSICQLILRREIDERNRIAILVLFISFESLLADKNLLVMFLNIYIYSILICFFTTLRVAV